MKYNVNLDTESWACGDGCCDGDSTTIHINDIKIGGYSDLGKRNYDGIYAFLDILNQSDEDLTLTFTIELVEGGHLDDVIYLNETKITNSLWACNVYTDILEKLQLPYRYIAYEIDFDVWDKEKRLVLVRDIDELRNA